MTQAHTPSNDASSGATDSEPRLGVQKTYKLYIGGAFPRTESGRHYRLIGGTDSSGTTTALPDAPTPPGGEVLANICLGSRKDFRNAVVAARKAQPGWAGKSAYLRSQILYRVAEMLEGRASQFATELVSMGAEPQAARCEVGLAIDRLVHYAGWADKYQQVFSAVNPVASSHFNFSMHEPTGVVAAFAPEESALAGLIGVIAPAILSGNTIIAIASHHLPLSAITLAEVLHTSDVPGGVINLITGERSELLDPIAGHMDVNAIIDAACDDAQHAALREAAAENLKRVTDRRGIDWLSESGQNPYAILDTTEVKTTWHPIGT